MSSVYQTKQRGIILECLSEHREQCLTAGELYAICRQRNAPVSLATVYRQLDILVEEGTISRIVADDHKGVRYQYRSAEQRHSELLLRCDCCGTLASADCSLLEEIESHMDQAHGFRIDMARSIFYGRCRQCE